MVNWKSILFAVTCALVLAYCLVRGAFVLAPVFTTTSQLIQSNNQMAQVLNNQVQKVTSIEERLVKLEAVKGGAAK